MPPPDQIPSIVASKLSAIVQNWRKNMTRKYTTATWKELATVMATEAVTLPAKKEVRLRIAQEAMVKTDEGTFFVGRLGALTGVWCFKQEGQPTIPARYLGEKWEEYKRNHPNWEKEGKE
jgi:hypothetical protein